MAVVRRYTSKPLQVDHTPETLTRIDVIAEREGVSRASVVRDLIDHGLARRERISLKRA